MSEIASFDDIGDRKEEKDRAHECSDEDAFEQRRLISSLCGRVPEAVEGCETNSMFRRK